MFRINEEINSLELVPIFTPHQINEDQQPEEKERMTDSLRFPEGFMLMFASEQWIAFQNRYKCLHLIQINCIQQAI